MRKYFGVVPSLLLALILCQPADAQTLAPSREPNPDQRAWMATQYGLFLCFGPNTFIGKEWGSGQTPVSVYRPTHLGPEQWIRVAKEGGFRYVILLTKHHDGFCLWPSRYTDYDVGSAPVRDDVVRRAADACRRQGVKLSLYYSLMDWHEPTYKDDARYTEFVKNQLTELLTNYGEVFELWFDGLWDKSPERWRTEEIYAHVKRLQPRCQVAFNHAIVKDKYFEGAPIQYWPTDFRANDPHLPPEPDPKLYTHAGQNYHLPFEATITGREATPPPSPKPADWPQMCWFYHPDNQCRLVPEARILEAWRITVGQGDNLVVNLAPDPRGLIPEADRQWAVRLRRALRKQGLKE